MHARMRVAEKGTPMRGSSTGLDASRSLADVAGRAWLHATSARRALFKQIRAFDRVGACVLVLQFHCIITQRQ